MAAMTSSRPLTSRQSTILSIVQANRRITRKEIARALDLPLPTVTRIVSDLRDERYLLEDESESRPEPGRPNSIVQVNPDVGYAIGVDLRKHSWSWALSNAKLQLVHRSNSIECRNAVSAESVRSIIASLMDDVINIGLQWRNISTIVFAVHAIVATNGDIFLGYEDDRCAFNVDSVASEASGKRCASNDPARMYVVVERDEAIDRPDSAYVLYGQRGHGMGIIVSGEILRSFNGICGEIGHIATWTDDGRRQTIADRTNGNLIVNEAMGSDWGKALAQSKRAQLTLADICNAARGGNSHATALLCEHAARLAPALAATVSLLGSETLVLGGEWIDSGETVRRQLLAEIRRNLAGALSERLAVRYGRHGPDSIASGGALYGARLIWE
ncbi:ROK family protein [Mesorhizobium sp. BAC0120]|uniref:ROK family transcriptional regulator n=1 Tax=Mesorhizobium sp. BAC0120 TaxID=3090670 RepID=UPI00298C1B75|nr:ROK family protein [Mesorhizobium sp. BAC0120]MDW6024209.1 ROK family protein [Mesorhizobium sp. BAC0120]